MNLIDKISYSNTTLIGYDTQNEQSVEKLLRFLPSVILFENVSDKEIMEHFRDYKLSSILNNQSINYVVVDLSTISYDLLDTNEPITKARYIRSFIQELQSRLYTLSNTDSPIKFKLILLSKLYYNPQNAQIFFSGGDSTLYISELVIKFLGDTISIEKDRMTSNRYVQNIKEELREISIKSLFDELTTTT